MTLLNRLLLIGLCFTLPTAVLAKPYKGGEIYSQESFLYGKFEMQMQAAPGSGVLSTFFTYKNGSEIGSTFWEEIDIEIFGKGSGNQWQSNIILGSQRPTLHTEAVHTAPNSLTNSYNRYRLEWTPEYVAWFVNDVEVRRINEPNTVTSLTSPQSLRFNLWASDAPGWVGEWNANILPTHQFIDYFAYTPYNTATGSFDTSSPHSWRDDFNSFDSVRWGKADWTFDGNRVDFSPSNVNVRNGVLVLSLTHEGAEGYNGTPPQPPSSSSSSSSSSSVPASSSASDVSSDSSVQSSESSSWGGQSSAAASSVAYSSISSSMPASQSSASLISSSSSSLVSSASSNSVASIASSAAASSTPTIKVNVSKSGGAFHWLGLLVLAALGVVARKR